MIDGEYINCLNRVPGKKEASASIEMENINYGKFEWLVGDLVLSEWERRLNRSDKQLQGNARKEIFYGLG